MPGQPLLLSEPRQRTLADALRSVKQGVSRRLIAEAAHFWQKRYYDFNVRNDRQFVEKLRYIHWNPAERGLCQRAEDWEWSNFRQYRDGLRRDRNCPTQAKGRLEWATRGYLISPSTPTAKTGACTLSTRAEQ
jgi:hypothetical protein